MSNPTIWDYPKSSCNCWKCTSNKYSCQDGAPTNMGTRDCSGLSYQDCYYGRPFRSDVEPAVKRGKTNMNPQMMTSKYATDFVKVKCPNGGPDKPCPGEKYASMDPRLVSASHFGQIQILDIPPLDPRVKLDTLLVDPSLDAYGQNYSSYSDIKAGNIMYYIDHEIEDPFFYPNFTVPAQIEGVMYKDPMGAPKPQYDRYPVKCRNVLDPDVNAYNGGLSWLQDSLEQREDLMARQMRKHNEKRYEPRWSGVRSSCSSM